MNNVEHIELQVTKEDNEKSPDFVDISKKRLSKGYDITAKVTKQALNAINMRDASGEIQLEEEKGDGDSTLADEGDKNPNKLNQHELDEFLMSNYPIISPGQHY